MSEDLGTRLLRAGLATTQQLERALALVSRRGGPLGSALVDCGVSEEALVGFLVAEGFGPAQHAAQLADATPEAIARLPARAAHGLLALPLGWTPAGLVVAMADPSDRAALAELQRLTGETLLPAVARVSDLRSAIRRHYGEARPGSRPPATVPAEPVVELVRRRSAPTDAPAGDPPTGTRQASRRITSRSFPRPREAEAPEDDAARSPTTEPTSSATVPERARRRSAPEASRVRRSTADLDRRPSLPSYDRWDPNTGRRTSVPPPPTRRRTTTDPSRPGVVGLLAELGRCSDRDQAVDLACRAAARLGRAAIFLANHRGVLKGRHGAGRGIPLDAIRNLWLPLSTRSTLTDVARTGEAHRGGYGREVADRLVRSAMGAEGDRLHVEPVLLGRRVVGLVCVDDPYEEPGNAEDVRAVAEQLGEALLRVLTQRG